MTSAVRVFTQGPPIKIRLRSVLFTTSVSNAEIFFPSKEIVDIVVSLPIFFLPIAYRSTNICFFR